MRVCLVSQEYPPETARGGIGSQTYLRAHGLSAMGHDVTVLSHSVDDRRHCYSQGLVKVVRIPNRDHQMELTAESVRWLAYSLEVTSAIQSMHQKKSFELVVFPDWGGEGYTYFLNRAAWNFIPSIVHIHGSISMFTELMGWPEKDSELFRTGTEMERTSLLLADALSASSVFSAEWCRKYYGLKRGDIPVLHSGVDTRLFSPRTIDKTARPTIIFVGNVSVNKGVYLLTEAACLLRHEFPKLKLQIIGKGPDKIRKQMLQIAQSQGAEDLIDFPGYIHREDLPGYLSKAHVFAGPSRFEGGPGNVYLEAMACGIPAIASKATGAAEVIQDGSTGYLVAQNDVVALTNKLRAILSDDVLRQQMGASAREFVLEHADSEKCLKKLAKFYVSVASRFKKSTTEV